MEKFPLKYGCADRAPKSKEYALYHPKISTEKYLKNLKNLVILR